MLLLTFILLLGNMGNAFSWQWHTNPDKWKEPRLFHSPFEKSYENRILISHKIMDKQALKDSKKERIYSSNKGYWFVIHSPDIMKPGPWSTKIEVFNERNYIIKIELIDTIKRHLYFNIAPPRQLHLSSRPEYIVVISLNECYPERELNIY